MPVTSYKDSMKDMVTRHPNMALEMLEDSINTLLSGNVDEGRLLLRQYVNATIGFKELASRTGKQDKNLMRSLSETGNPTAANLFEIMQACLDYQNVEVSAHIIQPEIYEPA